MVASQDEFGSVPSSAIFWNSFRRISVNSSLNVWHNLPVKPACPGFLFVGSLGGGFVCLSIYLFLYCCVGSSLLCAGFLSLWRAGATLRCGSQASHCGDFSCCRAWALGHTGFSSCGTWASVVWLAGSSAGSVVVAHRLSCSAACGIFPDQGLNPWPLHWQADS